MKTKIAVLGGGSWGVTLANVVADKTNDVIVWAIEESVCNDINKNHKNSRYLGDAELSIHLKASSDFSFAVKNADVVLWAVPSQAIRSVIEENLPDINKNIIHISVSKGLEQSTHKRISEIFEEYGLYRHVYLAGPSHAEEVSRKLVTTISAISDNIEDSKFIQELFSTDYFRVYTNHDMLGAELAGAFKNVVAIAAGICAGAGLGDNAVAALITRSLVELGKLVKSFGAEVKTITGLTGVGDLIVTCTSKHSRNRHVGFELGQEKSLEEILNNMVMVAEGVTTSKAFYELAKERNIEMPIVDATYKIIYKNYNVTETVQSLMTRELKAE
jgi:glycerol-3-phosphate dehydrogenase (NAD(P)+)